MQEVEGERMVANDRAPSPVAVEEGLGPAGRPAPGGVGVPVDTPCPDPMVAQVAHQPPVDSAAEVENPPGEGAHVESEDPQLQLGGVCGVRDLDRTWSRDV